MIRRAFTLLELLVTATIILVLLTMILSVAQMVRNSARNAITRARMQEIQRAIADYGDAVVIHQALAAAGMSGVVRFSAENQMLHYTPAQGSWVPWPYPNWMHPSPWGRKPSDDFTGGALPSALPLPTAVLVPPSRSLVDFNATFTATVLLMIGVMDSPTQWIDRGPKRAWNDAWGNPLIVGLALFQPPQNSSIGVVDFYGSGQTSVVYPDLFTTRATAAYGYNRSWYWSIGALGPTTTPLTSASLRDASADWKGSAGLYKQAWDIVCQTTAASTWNSAGGTDPFAVPPWKGIKMQSVGSLRCFITEPLETR